MAGPLLFIYNPTAGRGRLRSHIGNIVECFAAHGWRPTLYPTFGPGDAVSAAEMGNNYDRVVCGGGDGTLNEVITGLLRLDDPPPLGYIPAGTTNDFARTLNIPRNRYVQAAKLAAVEPAHLCDVGLFRGSEETVRQFIYVAAFGVFTDVSYRTPHGMKTVLGHTAYVLEGVASLTALKTYPLRVETDERCIQGEFIYGMVSNSVSVGGFRGVKADAVVLDDGLFEVMLVRSPKSLEEFNSIVASLSSRQPNGNVIGFQARKLTFTSLGEPIPWTLDGEFGGAHLQAEVGNRSCAIRICRPQG